MTTAVVNVPVGAPQLFRPGPIPFSCYAHPGATGTVLLETSRDSGTSFQASPIGTSTTGAGYSVGGIGDYGTIIRATASTVAGTLLGMDLSLPSGGMGVGIGGAVVCQSAVAQATPNSTSELTLFSMRFPAGAPLGASLQTALKLNFTLDVDLMFTATNNVNVKTIKAYMANSQNVAIEVAAGGLQQTQVLTSSSGGRMSVRVSGRNDGATLVSSSIGAALGWGISTTAPTVVSSGAAYAGPAAVEQALSITCTKATGTDTVTLDSTLVRLFQ